MKKVIFPIVVLMLILVGCGDENYDADLSGKPHNNLSAGNTAANKDEDNSKTTYDIDVNKLADEIRNSVSFEDELNEGMDVVFMRQYELKEDDFIKQCSYFGTNATTEEIAVVECLDEAAALEVEKAMKERIDKQKEVFADYAPDEVKRLENCVVEVLGRYAILCVSKDSEKVLGIIEQYR